MNYIGVTIGPIVDTMRMTSTPGGLWLASSFFSSIIRDFCVELQDAGKDILTLPEGYVVKEHEPKDGVGRYHDRIYYKDDADAPAIREELAVIIRRVLERRAEEMSSAFQSAGEDLDTGASILMEFLEDYVQIHYVILAEDNVREKGIASSLADALDALELARTSILQQESGHNALRKLLSGTKAKRNEYIRRYPKMHEAAESPAFPLAELAGGEVRIHNIVEIGQGALLGASHAREGKSFKYFAVVQCDGDSMGKTIASESERGDLTLQEARIRKFSSLCMEYIETSAKLVTEYGGAVIYGGGDDLLFLAPVLSPDAQGESYDIWTLCRAIGRNFDEIFSASDAARRPSVSIGMAIQYNKFPLYEAFDEAQAMLFQKAKHFTGEKNNLAVKLRKHSGQSVYLCSRMETRTDGSAPQRTGFYDAFLDFLHAFYLGDTDAGNKVMHSVLYHMEQQKRLFGIAAKSGNAAMVRSTFRNVFDNSGQKIDDAVFDKLVDVSLKACAAGNAGAATGHIEAPEDKKDESALDAMLAMLRLTKFLAEED